MPLSITNQFWAVGDTNPTTQVWDGPLGQFDANNGANFLTWLNANDGRADQMKGGTVVATANNGSGLIRVQVTGMDPTIATGQVMNFVGNNSGAAGAAAVTVIDATHFDIQGSTFSVADTAGVIWAATPIDTAADLYQVIDSYNQTLIHPGYNPQSSSVDITLTNPVARFNKIIMTVSGKKVFMPKANLFGSQAIGGAGIIYFLNDGANPFTVVDSSGTSIVSLQPNDVGLITLIDNSTTHGTYRAPDIIAFPSAGIANDILIDDGTIWQKALVLGDVTISYGGGVATNALKNIPNDTPMAGDLLATEIAAPSAPAAGKLRIYGDSTSNNLAAINHAGTVNHGVQTKGSVAHNFLTAIADDGTVSAAQPAFTDISGSVAATQLPNPSATTLGGIESLASVAHKWINTISTSGVPSATQPASTDLSDIPIPVASGGTGNTGGAWASWSPTATAQTPGGTPPTFTVNNASYEQIGKKVWFHFDITCNTVGTASGTFKVTLPVTARSQNQACIGTEVAVNGRSVRGFIGSLGDYTVVATMQYDGSTSPFSYGNGFEIVMSGTFEAA